MSKFYNVNTWAEGSKIYQHSGFGDARGELRDQLVRKCIDVEEEGIKQTLMQLGWIPPGAATRTAELTESIDMVTVQHLIFVLGHAGLSVSCPLDRATGARGALLHLISNIAGTQYVKR
jgi:hypothetical protein